MSQDFTPDDMTGKAFDQKAEKRHNNQPDYTGLICIRGEVFRVAMWHNPPTERCKVSTYNMKIETEVEHQARVEQAKIRQERRQQTRTTRSQKTGPAFNRNRHRF